MNFPKLKQKADTDWMSEAMEVLKPGMILYGYCGGYFGRDSYDNKTIKSVKIVVPEYKNPYLQVEVDEEGVLDYTQLDCPSEVTRIIEASNNWLEDQEEQEREWEEQHGKR